MISSIPLRKLAPPLRWFASQAARLIASNPLSETHDPGPGSFRTDLRESERRIPYPTHPFDLQHGTDTSGFIGGADLETGHPHDRYNTAYYAMSPFRFEQGMGRWLRDTPPGFAENYSFIDLGSGKGRALLLASALPFRQVIGVELHRELARVSEANVRIWEARRRARCPIRVHCQDAIGFRFPPGPCLLYLFHPFATPLLDVLLSSLAEQFQSRSDALDLLYFNPEGGDRIERHPGFRRLWTEVLPISEGDATADALANEGDLCSAYRWIGIPGEVAIGGAAACRDP